MTDMRSQGQGFSLVDSVYERLLAERIIFLGSQVDDDIANKLCAQILLLSAEDPTKDIHLYINSPGGSISAGMEEVLLPVMYDIPSRDDVAKVVVTKETVEDNVLPTIVPRKPSRPERRDKSA